MYQFLWRRECKPSLSVISAAFIALGRSLEENIQKSVQQCSVHVTGVPGSSPTPALNPQSYLWPPRGSGLQPWNSPSFFLPSLSLHSHSSTLGKPIGSTCKVYLESDRFSLGLLKLLELVSWLLLFLLEKSILNLAVSEVRSSPSSINTLRQLSLSQCKSPGSQDALQDLCDPVTPPNCPASSYLITALTASLLHYKMNWLSVFIICPL